jgi:hypothetical protein
MKKIKDCPLIINQDKIAHEAEFYLRVRQLSFQQNVIDTL